MSKIIWATLLEFYYITVYILTSENELVITNKVFKIIIPYQYTE